MKKRKEQPGLADVKVNDVSRDSESGSQTTSSPINQQPAGAGKKRKLEARDSNQKSDGRESKKKHGKKTSKASEKKGAK